MEGVHDFPLPETVTHQLDELQDQIEHQPLADKARDFVRQDPWRAVFFSAVIGLFIGILWRRA